MAENTIGGAGPAKGKQCAHCGEPFGFQEFTNYMFKIWSNQIDCIACTEKNYLASSTNTSLKIILFLIAVLIGIVFFLGINLVFAASTYDQADGSFYISWWLVMIGIFGGIATIKYALAVFRWMTGTLMKKNPNF